MKKGSFLLATATGVSLMSSSCAGNDKPAEFIELSNGYGLTKTGENYYVIKPASAKEFNSADIERLLKNGDAIKLDKEMLAKMNELTSSIDVLL